MLKLKKATQKRITFAKQVWTYRKLKKILVFSIRCNCHQLYTSQLGTLQRIRLRKNIRTIK